jgi:hypothetical protein
MPLCSFVRGIVIFLAPKYIAISVPTLSLFPYDIFSSLKNGIFPQKTALFPGIPRRGPSFPRYEGCSRAGILSHISDRFLLVL